MTAAEGLFEAVRGLNSTARDKIVRTWLIACTDVDAKEWRRLVDTEKHRRAREIPFCEQRDKIPLEQGKPTGQNPAVPPEQGNVAGRATKAKEAVFSLDSLSEENPGEKEKPLRGKKKETAPLQSEAEWLAELQGEQIYRRVDVQLEAGKCRQWSKTNGKGFSKRRFVNWLNTALDRAPMSANFSPAETRFNGHRPDAEEMRRKFIGRPD